MKRISQLSIVLLLGTASLAFAQIPAAEPEVPEDAFSTRPLIAWSSMQKPHPTPQPRQEPDTLREPGQQETGESSAPVPQAFVGQIAKVGQNYVLAVDGANTYQLGCDLDLAGFENENVRLEGTLDVSRKVIHVSRVVKLS